MILSNNPLSLAKYIPRLDFVKTIQDYMDLYSGKTSFAAEEKKTFENGITVIPIRAAGDTKGFAPLEVHRIFFDIHFTIQGNDIIAYKKAEDCSNVLESYNEKGDYILYNERPDNTLVIKSGFFCIIPNTYAHAALYENSEDVFKLVFKIPVF